MRLATVFVLGGAVAGCSVGPNYSPPQVPVAPAFRAVGGVATGGSWWLAFGDPVLNRLEDEAAVGSLSLEQALARVEQARAGLRGADAALLPAADVNGSVARSQQSLNAGLGQVSRLVPTFGRTVNRGQLNVGASWDLDFAGGVRRQREASRANVVASEAGVVAARLAVAADLADAYAALRGVEAQSTQLAHSLAYLQDQRRIIAVRVRTGAAAAQALNESDTRVAAATAALAPLRALAEAQRNRIAVLMGRPPSELLAVIDAKVPVPDAPDPAIGVPADILRSRPDVVIAEQQLITENARIGAALAEYYPKFSLSALLGLDSNRLASFASSDSVLAQGAFGVRWRLFDFGRIDAEVRTARGRTREALAAYRAAILRASEDVETSFAQLAATRDRVRALEAVNADRLKIEATARRAYAVGGISRDALIDARRGTASAEADLAAARADRARAIVAAHRALGS